MTDAAGQTLPVDPNIAALITRLQAVFLDHTLYKRLLACHGPGAQTLLDSLQWLLDMRGLHSTFRRNLIVATQRLASSSGLYPVCYELEDVVQGDPDPVVSGGFGDIYKGVLYGQMVCVKAIRVYQRDQIEYILKRFSKEAILWGQLSHPNVLPIYGLYRYRNRACLVSPWMEEGDITQFLQRKPGFARLPLAINIAQGLSYLHKNTVIHGDLKGANVSFIRCFVLKPRSARRTFLSMLRGEHVWRILGSRQYLTLKSPCGRVFRRRLHKGVLSDGKHLSCLTPKTTKLSRTA